MGTGTQQAGSVSLRCRPRRHHCRTAAGTAAARARAPAALPGPARGRSAVRESWGPPRLCWSSPTPEAGSRGGGCEGMRAEVASKGLILCQPAAVSAVQRQQRTGRRCAAGACGYRQPLTTATPAPHQAQRRTKSHLSCERQRPALWQHPLPPGGNAARPPRLQHGQPLARAGTAATAAAAGQLAASCCGSRRCCISGCSRCPCSACLPPPPAAAAACCKQLLELLLSAKRHYCRRAAAAAGAAHAIAGAPRLRRQPPKEAGSPRSKVGGPKL